MPQKRLSYYLSCSTIIFAVATDTTIANSLGNQVNPTCPCKQHWTNLLFHRQRS